MAIKTAIREEFIPGESDTIGAELSIIRVSRLRPHALRLIRRWIHGASVGVKAERQRGYVDTQRYRIMQYPSYPLRDGEAPMSEGLIDSFCLAHIAVFIEEAWGVYIPDPELTVELMDTLDLIAARALRG